jgi:hypothetical protein
MNFSFTIITEREEGAFFTQIPLATREEQKNYRDAILGLKNSNIAVWTDADGYLSALHRKNSTKYTPFLNYSLLDTTETKVKTILLEFGGEALVNLVLEGIKDENETALKAFKTILEKNTRLSSAGLDHCRKIIEEKMQAHIDKAKAVAAAKVAEAEDVIKQAKILESEARKTEAPIEALQAQTAELAGTDETVGRFVATIAEILARVREHNAIASGLVTHMEEIMTQIKAREKAVGAAPTSTERTSAMTALNEAIGALNVKLENLRRRQEEAAKEMHRAEDAEKSAHTAAAAKAATEKVAAEKAAREEALRKMSPEEVNAELDKLAKKLQNSKITSEERIAILREIEPLATVANSMHAQYLLFLTYYKEDASRKSNEKIKKFLRLLIAQPCLKEYGGLWTDQIIDSFKKLRDTGNITTAEFFGYFQPPVKVEKSIQDHILLRLLHSEVFSKLDQKEFLKIMNMEVTPSSITPTNLSTVDWSDLLPKVMAHDPSSVRNLFAAFKKLAKNLDREDLCMAAYALAFGSSRMATIGAGAGAAGGKRG